MNRLNPCESYRNVATQTASRGQLVLMLYEGAIRKLEEALGGFAIEDPAESISAISNNILRAQEIVRELNYALDLDQGGELALQLRRLYDYFDRKLDESNRAKDSGGIKEVIERLTTLRDAWSEMLRNQAAQPVEGASGRTAVLA